MKKHATILSIFFAFFLIDSRLLIADETLVLGAALPLSGDYAPYGNDIKNGCELAKKELEKQGINVNIIYEDVPSPDNKAISAIRKLIDYDQIKGLVANFWNPVIPIIDSELYKANLPAFHTACADDLILSTKSQVYSTNHKIKDEAYKIADFLYNQQKIKKTSVMYIGTTFGEHYAKYFKKYYTEFGGEVLSQDMTLLGDYNFRTVLTRIKSLNPEALFLAYFGTNLGIVLKQVKQMGFNLPIISVYEAEDQSVIDNAGKFAEGLKYFMSEPAGLSPEQKKLLAKYANKYQRPPSILARNAYDATILLSKALHICQQEVACVRSELNKTKNFPGLSGIITIDQEGGTTKEFVLKKIKEGEFVVSN